MGDPMDQRLEEKTQTTPKPMTEKSGQKIRGVIAVALGKATTVAVDNRDQVFAWDIMKFA